MPMPSAPSTPQTTDARDRADGGVPGPASLKHRAVERWVARHLGAVDHEQRVAQIASTLFNLTWPLHRLAVADLKLLRLAAAVHDVGRSVDDANHPAEGAKMLLDDQHLPLSATERRLLAYLTLHHRGKVPAAGKDDVLARGDDAGRMLNVLALLRAADALDNRILQSPRLVFALVGVGPTTPGRSAPKADSEPELRITCYLDTDCDKARKAYQRRKKFRLLEERFGCAVEIEIAHADALQMVA
jgi:exopolyphosphatase/pppGpp-phosphohydrolase